MVLLDLLVLAVKEVGFVTPVLDWWVPLVETTWFVVVNPTSHVRKS